MSLTPEAQPESSPASLARALVANARTATLATLDCRTGHPYASLVAVTASSRGMPILLLSGLALHTRNSLADSRASLLFHAVEAAADPLAEGRVTLVGGLCPTADPSSKARFLAHHPEARTYVDFADFAFYEFNIERGHFIGGFGRIVELPAQDLLD